MPNLRRTIVLLTLAAAAITAVVPAGRVTVLQAAGTALVSHDPIVAADAIVVSASAEDAGVLTAADLFAAHVASRVAVFADPPLPEDREFIRRGLAHDTEGEAALRSLHELRIPNPVLIEKSVAGTEEESRVLPRWAAERGLRSVVVVTSPDHARRMRRLLKRATKGAALEVMIQPATYAQYQPGSWWRTRDGVRTQIIETQKLLLDLLRHPLQ
jgi:uncharacterized SAM-binding protein YcdF (DUF218 family)